MSDRHPTSDVLGASRRCTSSSRGLAADFRIVEESDMQKYSMWCCLTHGHQMDKAPADTFGYYIASEADARIAELEHELDIRKAAIEAQFRLMKRVEELEKVLADIAAMPAEENEWDAVDKYHEALRMAAAALGRASS